MNPINERIVTLVRREMTAHNLRSAEVCRRTGVDNGSLSRILHGQYKSFTATTAEKLMNGLNLKFAELDEVKQ